MLSRRNSSPLSVRGIDKQRIFADSEQESTRNGVALLRGVRVWVFR